MREFKDKRARRKILFSYPVIVLLGLAVFFLGISTIKVYLKARSIAKERENLESGLSALEKKETEIGRTLKRLETGAGEEEELRKRFNIQKPGERTLIIVERNLGSGSLSEESLNNNFLKRVFIFLKNAIY